MVQLTEHIKPWSKTASLMLAAAKEMQQTLNTHFPYESVPDKVNWNDANLKMLATSERITNSCKKGFCATHFLIETDTKSVSCFKHGIDKKTLFFTLK